MKFYKNPSPTIWKSLCDRPQLELEFLDGAVRNILTRVQQSGDAALRTLTKLHDKIDIAEFQVSEKEILEADSFINAELKIAIQVAARNIEKFHATQQPVPFKIETTPGVTCWRNVVAIDTVGIYIPGGTAPLFSTVLMLAIPAKLAGCKEIILCSPPNRDGKLNPAILFAAKLTGVTKIFKVGGSQAIAAMAYGTESIPKVRKIFGPGNQYVTKAKQLVNAEGTAIDLLAGPSEVLVLADESADPSFVAADLLSQAEHGIDSQVMLVVTQESILIKIEADIKKQLATLPRKEIAEKALFNSRAIYFDNTQTAIDFINQYAPEHLIINTKDADEVADKIVNAGSVFIGNYSPEAAGDYASGTNHTLPTNGYAVAHSGVSLESFVKYITFQKLSATGIQNLGPVIAQMAEAEGLEAHKRAISMRLDQLKSKSCETI